MFANDRYITITAAFEAGAGRHTSLEWLAPELKEAGLRMVGEAGGPWPSRVWAGAVDEATYEQFAAAWQLPEELLDEASAAPYSHTFDGLNWEAEGRSPVVYVTLSVSRPRRARPPMAGHGIART